MQPPPPPSVRAVTIPFADVKDRSKDLSGLIQEGFGPRGLGIVSITDVPGYPELRRRLLRLAPRIVNLPDDVKKQLEDPDSRYHFGWSRVEEKFEPGRCGLYPEVDKEMWCKGADAMLNVAKDLLASQTTKQVNMLLLQDHGGEVQDEEKE